MDNAKLIEGLNETVSGLTKLIAALGGETISDYDAIGEAPKTGAGVNIPVSSTIGRFDPDTLNAMPYNEFKKLAARLGVSCKGTREDIMKRVMALDIAFDGDSAAVGDVTIEKTDSDATVPVHDKKPGRKTSEVVVTEAEDAGKKSDKPVGGKRGLVKKTVQSAPDEFDAKAKEIADSTSVPDILSALKGVGVKATKDDYLTKLAAALREGKLEVEDEDDASVDEEANEAESPDDEEGEIDADEYFPGYDPKGFNNPYQMTEERQEAIISKMDEILTDYSEGKLTSQEVQDYLTEKATQEELDLLGDDPSDVNMLKAYMELVKRTIDNEGSEHTEEGDPYMVGDIDMCCAHPLKQVRKTGKFVCEMCGSEYEAESE